MPAAAGAADVPGDDEDYLPEGQTALAVGDEVVVDDTTMRRALEAILMVTDEPLPVLTLARAVGRPTGDIAAALAELAAEYTEQGRGFDLREVGGGWRYYTRPDAAQYVERFVLDGQQSRITQAALETLAVVAYKQPVSRARVSAIRGVNVDGVMRTLVARGLVEEAGADTESQATLYRTTTYFLERMGMQSLDDLPELAPYLPEMDDIEEELAAQTLPPTDGGAATEGAPTDGGPGTADSADDTSTSPTTPPADEPADDHDPTTPTPPASDGTTSADTVHAAADAEPTNHAPTDAEPTDGAQTDAALAYDDPAHGAQSDDVLVDEPRDEPALGGRQGGEFADGGPSDDVLVDEPRDEPALGAQQDDVPAGEPRGEHGEHAPQVVVVGEHEEGEPSGSTQAGGGEALDGGAVGVEPDAYNVLADEARDEPALGGRQGDEFADGGPSDDVLGDEARDVPALGAQRDDVPAGEPRDGHGAQAPEGVVGERAVGELGGATPVGDGGDTEAGDSAVGEVSGVRGDGAAGEGVRYGG
ncbi:SMC-Scp complex subunit ScpB [Kribbella sp. WER1]